ncbi:MAG: hypothetical protein A3F87_02855 [Omnitrophica WOR_2 bacterium RIFCSPLOWO2_12_FULL_51_24]|nr:MAG: hypothetical protein A3I43_05435 [Omnitrophica WOR_2 bacterium RIFCSPLOWO2_02_FULL_50_19]OGX42867.1 MAG: hypothetical protein A3F87_02855 [Omnitrophica WOR_2 bacterium RIFCSPLOWO2_12_FULL_51_24]
MKVARAVGRGFSVTHRGWPVIAVVFVFYTIIRFFVDWGAATVIFAAVILGFNYLLAGTQIFARDGIKDGRYAFKGFFGNCNRFFLGQFGVSLVLWISAWILAFLAIVLLGGPASAVLALFLMVFLALTCMSWTITAADGKNVFKSIWNSILFCGRRFFSVLGLLILIFVLAITISLVVWIAYAFVVQGLRHLGLDGRVIILREVTGCALYAYFFLFSTSSLMSYYLNNRKEDERHN